MKRVVSLVAALALAVGAFAPAAFASDAGYGQTDLIPLEDLDQETFDTYLSKFYSQDYPTYGVLDLIRDTFQGGLSNASGVNDSVWSWALNLVDNAGDVGTEIGLWLQGVKIDPNTGKVIYPDDYLSDYAKDLLDTQIYTIPSSSIVSIGSGDWVQLPFTIGSYSFYYFYSDNGGSTAGWTAYATNVNGKGLICVDIGDNTNYGTTYYSVRGDNGASQRLSGGSVTGTVHKGRYSPLMNSGVPSGISSSQYSSLSAATSDFYNNPVISNAAPVLNGSGYYSDHQDSFSINLPSLPSTNWGNLSKYYYTTYGDQIIDGNVDRYYYNIANNYVPYEVSYDLPYWLINGSIDILNFDYSLELPTAELSTLPADFEGGSNFWDSSFGMLGGFSSFILLGLSFALVGLFFKD